jgi:hypothetical protein
MRGLRMKIEAVPRGRSLLPTIAKFRVIYEKSITTSNKKSPGYSPGDFVSVSQIT